MYKTRRCAGSFVDADVRPEARSAAAQFLRMLHDFSAGKCAGLPKGLRGHAKSAHFQGGELSEGPKQQCKTFNKLARRALTESELGFNIALSIEAHQTSVTVSRHAARHGRPRKGMMPKATAGNGWPGCMGNTHATVAGLR